MTTCIEKPLVDAHFEGTISPESERRMRAHLPTCASCMKYYERRLLLSRLDPSGLPVEERLALGLGLAARRSGASGEGDVERGTDTQGTSRVKLVVICGLVAAAAVILLWVFARRPEDDGFAARGGLAKNGPYVRVYRAAKGGVPEPLVGTMRRDDELAFAYESVPGRERLMVFGLDEHGHVYWFYPAWTDRNADPVAVPVTTIPGLHPLPEAVAHELDGHTLEVHALFSSAAGAPRTVRTIEQSLAGKKAPMGPIELEGTLDLLVPLEVAP